MTTAREELRQYVREVVTSRVNGHRWDGADTRATIDALRDDPEALRLLADCYLPGLVRDAAELALARQSPPPDMEATTRPMAEEKPLRTQGGALVRRDFIDRTAAELEQRWEGWLERVGDRQIPFLDMTRKDLLLASRHRKERGMQEIELSLLEVRIAKTLKGTERVRDRYTPDDLDDLRAEVRELEASKRREALGSGE